MVRRRLGERIAILLLYKKKSSTLCAQQPPLHSLFWSRIQKSCFLLLHNHKQLLATLRIIITMVSIVRQQERTSI